MSNYDEEFLYGMKVELPYMCMWVELPDMCMWVELPDLCMWVELPDMCISCGWSYLTCAYHVGGAT